jgi:hypothetical protein
MRISIFFLVNILFHVVSHAQQFSHKSKVPDVKQKAFYHILLPVSLAAYAESDYRDLRLFNDKGKEVPYLLKKENFQSISENFRSFEMIRNEQNQGIHTIVIHNPDKQKLSELLVELANADAERPVRISGSDNEQDWFVVRDGFYFSALELSDETKVFKALQFPASDYRYFKIEIKNNNKPSLAISKIGISTQIRVQNVLQKVDAITWSKKDSNRKTIIDVFCKPANRIDRLRFVIRDPKLFQRDVRIYATEKEVQESLPIGSSVKIKRAPQAPLIMRASLNALQATIINLDESLSRLQQDHLIIEIENDDNIPLSIESIQAYQLNTFITAELYPDRHYFMYCGDSMLSFPQYDLIYFQNKIPSDTKVIQAEEALLKTINVSDEFDGSQDRKLVWIGSGILCIILLLLVAQMLRKIKNATPETTPQAD